jgi:hypothetical protein
MGETKTQATSKKESSLVRDASAALTPSFLFDLDGTLVDSVYQHVLAWRELSNKPASNWPYGAFTAELA